jgi:hypothetical protein
MKWLDRGGISVSSPYRVLRDTRGWSAWIYSKAKSGCLGRGMATLKEAQKLCEKHKASQVAA